MSNFVALLVEDDPLQREVMSALLRGEGLEVLECATAEAGELVVASTGAELLALVTDQNLAGEMTGADLAEFARGRYPKLTIVVMSGSPSIRCRRVRLSSASPLRPATCCKP